MNVKEVKRTIEMQKFKVVRKFELRKCIMSNKVIVK